MNILKAEYPNKRAAKHSMSGMHGIKSIRLGSAVVWLSNIHNTKQAENTVHSHKGYTVKPTFDDEKLLIDSI